MPNPLKDPMGAAKDTRTQRALEVGGSISIFLLMNSPFSYDTGFLFARNSAIYMIIPKGSVFRSAFYPSTREAVVLKKLIIRILAFFGGCNMQTEKNEAEINLEKLGDRPHSKLMGSF